MKKIALFPLVVLLLSIFTPMVYAGDLYEFLRYDGTDDYVSVADHVSMNFTGGDFTVEFWVRGASQAADVTILGKMDANDIGWYIWVFSNTLPHLTVYDTDWDDFEIQATTSVFDGEWHHILGRRNGTLMEIWIDDVMEDSENDATVGNADCDANLVIGNRPPFSDAYYKGDFDEFRMYSRDITDAEIAYSFANKEPQDETGLVLWLRFNEGTGDTTYDETANDNDGTLMPDYGASNAPEWVDESPPGPAGEAAAEKMEDAAQVAATVMILFVIIWAFSVVEGKGQLSDIWAYLLMITVILLIAGVVGGIG